jgi:hypothetical protein
MLARRLASGGSPVLRYHARGYGDSRSSSDLMADPDAHAADAAAAVEVLRDVAGPERVGMTGARFGASVALLAAGSSDATQLMLVEPVTDGRSYLRTLAVRVRASTLDADGHEQTEQRADGVLDLDGSPADRSLAEAFARLAPADAARGFGGRSLLLHVARDDGPDAALGALGVALGSAEGRCTLQTLVHPDALRLGLPRFRKVARDGEDRSPAGRRKTDVQASLNDRIVAALAAWATAQAGEGAPPDPGAAAR